MGEQPITSRGPGPDHPGDGLPQARCPATARVAKALMENFSSKEADINGTSTSAHH
jgi:hypothetical protein